MWCTTCMESRLKLQKASFCKFLKPMKAEVEASQSTTNKLKQPF